MTDLNLRTHDLGQFDVLADRITPAVFGLAANLATALDVQLASDHGDTDINVGAGVGVAAAGEAGHDDGLFGQIGLNLAVVTAVAIDLNGVEVD